MMPSPALKKGSGLVHGEDDPQHIVAAIFREERVAIEPRTAEIVSDGVDRGNDCFLKRRDGDRSVEDEFGFMPVWVVLQHCLPPVATGRTTASHAGEAMTDRVREVLGFEPRGPTHHPQLT
jgi:hypothetical protein